MDSLWDRVDGLVSEAESLLKHGKENGDARAWAGGIREARSCLELLGKIQGELNDSPQVNILLASTEFGAMANQILQALRPHPELRAHIAEVLSAPSS